MIDTNNNIKLLSNSSAKLDKSQNDEWLNAILYLEPTYNNKVCPYASKGCKASCLINSGMMTMPTQTKARYNRTHLYFNNKELFMTKLYKEINSLLKKAAKEGKKLAIRLNGTSDINWEKVYSDYPMIQFYEYTKNPNFVIKFKAYNNVHITFSATENTTKEDLHTVIKNGTNVAIVFDDRNYIVPKTYLGINVIDGDKTDRRFQDKKGSIIALKLKGTNNIKNIARKSGFARIV